MAAEQEPPLHGNAAWTSYVKSEYLDALGLRSQLVDWFPPQPKKPLEGELAREIDCASTGFGQSSDPPVMLLAPARVEALNGSDPLPEACRVLYLPAGAQLAGEAHVHGVLSEDEDALLPVFSATAPDQDFAPGTAKSRRYFFDAVPELPTDVAFKKKYVLSIYFLSPDSFCAGPNETQLSPEMVKADIAPQHVYVEDGTHQTREAAFKHYHFTMFCGDFSKEPFPPLALIYSLAYVAHAMVPEFLHWKGSRMFFHLPDASQGVRSTRILGLEAYLQSLMTSPSKEKVMEFKETFTLLCQVLFRYRYAEPAPRRAQVAACGLCDAKAREERRAIARGDEAVAVVFCVMSRRSAHELRQVVRETWGKGLAGKAPAVVQRFFVGQAANESHVLQDRDQGDVVELPVKESYRTLNLKALAMLSWAHERFPNLQWLVRHDDDVYLRAPALLAQLASRPPVRYLWGMGRCPERFDHGSSPVRDPAHQHYNSFEQFPKQDHPAWGDIFPPYARGLLWAMSADLVAATVREFREDLQEQPDIPLDEEAANRLPHPDDPAVGVLIAGLVRQGMSINLDDRDFNSFSLNPSCNSTFSNIHNRTWVVHHVKPETMRCMWDLDTAESAVGISDQNSVIDASSRIFPDLCRCSTEVVEEEDGEEEPFWYDKSRFNNARPKTADGKVSFWEEVQRRRREERRRRKPSEVQQLLQDLRKERAQDPVQSPTGSEATAPGSGSERVVSVSPRGSEVQQILAEVRQERLTRTFPGVSRRQPKAQPTPARTPARTAPPRAPALAPASAPAPAAAERKASPVRRQLFKEPERRGRVSVTGTRDRDDSPALKRRHELGSLGSGSVGLWSADLRRSGSPTGASQEDRFESTEAQAYPAGGWDTRTSCPRSFDDFPNGVIKRNGQAATRASRRARTPSASPEKRKEDADSERFKDAQSAVLRATGASAPPKEDAEAEAKKDAE
ncbi:unnamed protein product [Effrenium voratum]|uniref:Uncharacterized protein n=1 Tax=Effrenium voratum TaxID=2562239 RepID=A0AA36I973_9DINO|nr:unnamed protein product [Effrenium voratum]